MSDEPLAVDSKAVLAQKLPPLSLTVLLFVLDQATKLMVVRRIPLGSLGASFWGGILQIIHVTNTGIAFSLGTGLPEHVRRLFFALMPLLVVAAVLVVYFRNNDFSPLQRWAVAGIAGGGLGNLWDRFFRPEGVVDFIDVKFFGIFGLERWPTFNVADMAVLIFGVILFVSLMASGEPENP